MNEGDQSKIQKLKEVLYSRKIKIKPSFTLDLNQHKSTSPDNWQKEDKVQVEKEEIKKIMEDVPASKSDFAKKAMIGALGFFAICLCIAAYIFFKGSNVISPNNIKIDVIGPTTISSGEETELMVSITNTNNTTLEIADLILEYPDGTRSAKDSVTLMQRDRVPFGDISPRETVRKSIKSIMYGEEGKFVDVKLSLEYRVPNSTSVFTKESEYKTLVGSSPLTLSIEALKEVNSNQNYALTLKVTSNSNDVIKDIVLTSDFPFGFAATDYSPIPIPNEHAWVLGDIEPKGERTITINGKIFGEKNQERFFRFDLGTKSEADNSKLGAVIASVSHSVLVKQPFLGVGIAFDRNSESEEYVAQAGSEITATIDWHNNVDVPIYDVSIEAKISGNAIYPKSIKTASGFYDSSTNTIRWNKFYDEKMELANPGTGGNVDFSLGMILGNLLGNAQTNPQFVVDVTVKAKRRLESGVPEEIVSTIRKTVKVVTNPTIVLDSSYTNNGTNNIQNSGPVPPVVGKKTTYTLTLSASNTLNALADTSVVAVLPESVEWLGVTYPEAEQVTFNSNSRQIKWNIGDMPPATGGASTRKLYLQVAVSPSISEIGQVIKLLDIAKLTARDTFTNIQIQSSSKEVTTVLTRDQGIDVANSTGIVQE